MGYSEPLGTPRVDDPDTQESDTVVLDDDCPPSSSGVGASDAPSRGTASYANVARKMKRYFAEEDIGHMTFIA
jgi:hypothetical protein